MTVAIEPVVGDSTNTPQAARHILDMMQSPALGVILDMSNLVSFEGKNFAPDGTMLHTSLEDSCTDYAGAFAMLRTLPQPLPVLREEAVPARAASDIAFIRQFF